MDALFAGHDHSYEWLEIEGSHNFVNGSGGSGLRCFRRPLPGSRVRNAEDHGAQRILFDGEVARVEFWSVSGELIDSVSVRSREGATQPLLAVVGSGRRGQ